MNAPWIVLEGLDGTGKSSLARTLAQTLGARLLATPGEQLEPIRRSILDGLERDPAALVAFYGATVIARGRQARALTTRGVPVVMDRYLASTVAYAWARNVDLELSWLMQAAPRPDVQLLVTVPEPVRRARLAARGLGPEDRETLVPDFAGQVTAAYRALMPGHREVDNSEPLERVARRLAASLRAPATTNPELRS
jgi:dTMP kinase